MQALSWSDPCPVELSNCEACVSRRLVPRMKLCVSLFAFFWARLLRSFPECLTELSFGSWCDVGVCYFLLNCRHYRVSIPCQRSKAGEFLHNTFAQLTEGWPKFLSEVMSLSPGWDRWLVL